MSIGAPKAQIGDGAVSETESRRAIHMNQEGFERRIEVEQFSALGASHFCRGSVGGGHHVLTIHLPTQHFTGDRVGLQCIRPGIHRVPECP